MGYNTKHFDHEAHYASKSTKELQAILKKSQEFVKQHPQFEHSWHNEYIHSLKLRIAERIGKRK
jgi:hypothetical protein